MGLLGIFLALTLLIGMSYRGWSVLLLAPAAALLAAGVAGEPVLAHWTQTFMLGAAGFFAQFFPIFLLGALFGKLMDDSGSVRAISRTMAETLGPRRAILAVVLAGAFVTYGGVSLFVAFFVLAPMAHSLFKEANIPNKLMPAAIVLGTSTFTMSALPGTPAIQNAIPNPFFGTNAFAAPILGIIAGLIMFGGGMWWLTSQSRKAAAAGEGYDNGPLMRPGKGGTKIVGAGGHGADPEPGASGESSSAASSAESSRTTQVEAGVDGSTVATQVRAPFAVALVPILVVIGLNYALVNWVFPAMDTSYLAQKAYGPTDLKTVGGIWAIIAALVAACVLVVLLNLRRLKDAKRSINEGTMGSLLPIFNTASEVGYGAVIASLPAFTIIRDAVLGISGNPVINLAVAVNVLAGITGSASGGMSIALQTLGDTFREQAVAQGISLEFMHRVTAISSGGFDALPHNGAVITLLAITGLSHRQSYKDIGVVAVVVPVIALIVIIAIGSVFGGI